MLPLGFGADGDWCHSVKIYGMTTRPETGLSSLTIEDPYLADEKKYDANCNRQRFFGRALSS